jgi:hypothetical protein
MGMYQKAAYCMHEVHRFCILTAWYEAWYCSYCVILGRLFNLSVPQCPKGE